jgi:HEPN domain-containing protein
MNKEATHWLRQAIDDLETARILLDADRFGPCAFFCQQSAEKSLKAVIYDADERPWGHSIPSLLDQVCAVLRIEPELTPGAEAEALDEHYIRPRYPDARSREEAGYDRTTAEDALRFANTMLGFVTDRLRNA